MINNPRALFQDESTERLDGSKIATAPVSLARKLENGSGGIDGLPSYEETIADVKWRISNETWKCMTSLPDPRDL